MGRYYERDGRKYASCTTIISDSTNSSAPLIQWGANMVVEWIKENASIEQRTMQYLVSDDQLNNARFNFRKVSKKALNIGSEVHQAIEMYLQDRPYVLSTKEAGNAFDAFLAWKDEVNLKPIALEQTVYGDRWAGTLDMVAMVDGIKTVIDFKTSKNHYPLQHGPQIAAYRSCVENAEASGILRIDKGTGKPDYKDYSKRYEKDLAIFNAMVELFILRHPIIAKNIRGE